MDSHGGPWGWATVQALPRSLVLEQTEIGPRLRAEPIAEINSLRLPGTHTHTTSPLTVQPGTTIPLQAAGQSLDVVIRFTLPPAGSQQKWRCGLRVLANTFHDDDATTGASDSDSDSDTYVEIGLTNEPTLPSPPAPELSRFMPSIDFSGGDNGGSCLAQSNLTTPQQCQASCDASDACQVWTWVRRPTTADHEEMATPRCCFKACQAPGCGEAICCPGPSPSTCCDSGVKDPAAYHPRASPASGGGCPFCSREGARLRVYADTYRAGGTIGQGSIHGGDAFLSAESSVSGVVELRVLVDRSIVTSFVNNGSAAVTTRAYADGEEVLVFNGGEAVCNVQSVEGWEMEAVFPPRNGGFLFPHD